MEEVHVSSGVGEHKGSGRGRAGARQESLARPTHAQGRPDARPGMVGAGEPDLAICTQRRPMAMQAALIGYSASDSSSLVSARRQGVQGVQGVHRRLRCQRESGPPARPEASPPAARVRARAQIHALCTLAGTRASYRRVPGHGLQGWRQGGCRRHAGQPQLALLPACCICRRCSPSSCTAPTPARHSPAP